MRILIILIQYKPALNPNVFRWAAIAEHWVAEGHEVHLLCARRSGCPDEEHINGVQVHRAGQASLLDAAYNWLGTKQRRDIAGGEMVSKKGRLRRWLERLVDFTWRNVYWPDGSIVWYTAAKRRALQLQQEYQFDAMISVTQPFTPHLVANAVKKRSPRVHWLMDIEDPFAFSEAVFINNRSLYQKLNYRQEGKLLAQADAVSVTVKQAQALYEQYFPQVRGKIAVTPPMYSMPEAAGSFTFEKGKIHVAYFGAFYHPIRTPDALLELYSNLVHHSKQDFHLHFFGEIGAVFQPTFERYAALKPHLQLHGLVTRERVAAAMQSVDILVNVGNTTDYHLPSKSVDYMITGKPIINLSFHKNDPFRSFFEAYPLILNLDMIAGVQPIHIEQIRAFIAENQGKTVESNLLQQLTSPYLLAPVADHYFKLLQDDVQ
jgi:hypothetical protein